MTEIKRLTNDGFANSNARPQFSIDIHVGLFAEYSRDFVLGAVTVCGFDDDPAAAPKHIRQQLRLVVQVLCLVAERNIERVAHALQNR